MDNRKAPLFPEEASYGRPHAWYGVPLQPAYNDFVAPHPFHDYKCAYARNEVLNRLQSRRRGAQLYQVGGYRNMIPKPQPQGSFFQPFSVAGSNAYGVHARELIGGFRTEAGQAYGQQLLRDRAAQLREMELAEETGLPLDRVPAEVVQPVPLDRASEDYVAFQLLFSEIETQYNTGGFVKVPPAEVRKLFALFRKIYAEIPKAELEDLYERTYEIVQSISNTLPQEQEEGDKQSRAEIQAIYIGLYKLLALVKVAIASINKQPKERKRFMNAFIKSILKTRGKTVEENINKTTEAIDKSIKVLEGIPNYVEPSVPGLPLPDVEYADVPFTPPPRFDPRGYSTGFYGENQPPAVPEYKEEEEEGIAGDMHVLNPERFGGQSLASYNPFYSPSVAVPPTPSVASAPSTASSAFTAGPSTRGDLDSMTFVQLSALARKMKKRGDIPSNVRITGIAKSALLKRIQDHL